MFSLPENSQRDRVRPSKVGRHEDYLTHPRSLHIDPLPSPWVGGVGWMDGGVSDAVRGESGDLWAVPAGANLGKTCKHLHLLTYI